jgi:hypothetical protein
VQWIDAIFHSLQPVAPAETLHDGMTLPIGGKKMEAGEKRHRLRSHIRKDETAKILRRIGRMADALFEFAAGGFAWRLQNAPIMAVEPTMVTTPETVLLNVAETQIGSTMRALGA